MKRWQTWSGVVVLVVTAFVGSAGLSGEKEKSTDKPAVKAGQESAKTKETGTKGAGAKEAGTKEAGAKETKRRLPRYYGKLGLSDTQREKIYGIQSKYDADLDKLEKQLAELKNKQDADCRKILTADQKKQLTELVDATKARTAKDDEMAE